MLGRRIVDRKIGGRLPDQPVEPDRVRLVDVTQRSVQASSVRGFVELGIAQISKQLFAWNRRRQVEDALRRPRAVTKLNYKGLRVHTIPAILSKID